VMVEASTAEEARQIILSILMSVRVPMTIIWSLLRVALGT
jgi:hypothetical protein